MARDICDVFPGADSHIANTQRQIAPAVNSAGITGTVAAGRRGVCPYFAPGDRAIHVDIST